MTRLQMLNELRVKIDDTQARKKWQDRELLAFLAEGQDKFCEDTGYFTDVSTFTVDTIIDQAVYDIPERIISIKDIWYGTKRLGRYQEYLKAWGIPSIDSFTFNPDGQTPYLWQADEETGVLTLYPTPQEEVTLNLRVWRYSLYSLDDEDIDGNGTPASPELPFRLQRACIEWAAFKAYSDHDAEKGDTTEAQDHMAAYRLYVTDGKKAIRRRQSEETTVNGNPTYLLR